MAKDVLSTAAKTVLSPVKFGQVFLSPSIELAGTAGLILQADGGWQAVNDTLVFHLNPGQYFKVRIPIAKILLPGVGGADGLKLSSILTQLWIDRPHPQVIGTATVDAVGLPSGGTKDVSWMGGEDGPKKYKQAGYRWTTPQPFTGGGRIDVGFLQAQYGDELSVITSNFEPVTIHLMHTTLVFA
jgi:hypothetical protein